MNRIIKFGIFSLAVAFSSQVFAERDEFQLLQQDKEDKAVIAEEAHNGPAAKQGHQLDHGPRATTSQWVAKSIQIEKLKETPLGNNQHKQ